MFGYDSEIPIPVPDFKDVSRQMRINADVIMKEITDHVNAELERLKQVLNKDKDE